METKENHRIKTQKYFTFFQAEDAENVRVKKFASDFQSSLSEEKLTDLSPFRRKMGPVAKNLFQGQVSYNRIDQK